MSHFTVSGEHVYITVRDGGDVTLPCENVIEGQDKCDGTDWIFSQPQHESAELVKSGQINKTQISNRLSVTETCSLVIKNVTDKDFGLYSCRQEGLSEYSVVELSVVNITEHKDNNQVTLSCSVWTYDPCRHTVNWLFKGQMVEKDHVSLKISESDCSARVTVEDTHFVLRDKSDLLKCNVTDPITRKVQQFPFRRQSSGGETGEDTTTTSGPEQTTKSDTDTGTDASVTWKGWWTWLIAVIVGNETQLEEKTALSLNPAEPQSGPGTRQDTTDPEDGLSYASVNFTRTTGKSKVQIKDEGDDEGEAVTYSSVKTSAGASTDPSSLYAAVN
ncbi:hypothetical protein Q5P01_000415 [Channa striata]|uniref:Ig-like domain-containing protein n=1 Tax=Channa striata TaxID=64152 RepID=A0AA88LMF5_CHASR|nr:hypothetical protein Q5P01_000415 [Channa striata]